MGGGGGGLAGGEESQSECIVFQTDVQTRWQRGRVKVGDLIRGGDLFSQISMFRRGDYSRVALIRRRGWDAFLGSIMCCSYLFPAIFQQAPCGRWSEYLQIQYMHASVQSNGQILVNRGDYCVAEQDGSMLRAVSTSDTACQASATLFRLVGKYDTITSFNTYS